MVSKIDKKAMRLHRHVRVRGKISGTPERPRLCVFLPTLTFMHRSLTTLMA